MTPRPARESTDAELQALERVCEQLAGFGTGIEPEWVDGYFAALVAGPRAIPADEWLPAMCRDAFERAFADPQDAAQARAVLEARRAVVASQLDPQALDAQPDVIRLAPLIYIVEGEGEGEGEGQGAGDDAPRLGEAWSLGFQAAVSDFVSEWTLPPDVLPEEERNWFEGALAAVQALTHAPDALRLYLAATHPGRPPEEVTREQLLDDACIAVQDLRLFWVDRTPPPETRRVAPKPGRNDPCPCGSGRKYKKCHGAG